MRAAHLLVIVLLAGCTPSYYMGDPISAKSQVQSAQTGEEEGTSGEYRDKRAQQRADEWALEWQEIQSPDDAVKWTDHVHVCGLKYRFRAYDELFRCLDLLDAKIAAGGERVPKAELVQRGAPVMTGWLRASAYAELGEPETALKWAESAWAALPEAFRTADSSVTGQGMFGGVRDDLKPVFEVGYSLGGGEVGVLPSDMHEMFRQGRNNPAALNFGAPTVTMSLAVQRTLLYRRLGQADKANAAFADLERWKSVKFQRSSIRPYIGIAQLLSIGPLFAQGDYQRVISIYEPLAQKVGSQRQRESTYKTLNWTLLLPFTLYRKAIEAPIYAAMSPADARLFTLAVEDVSNALIYAQSLARLGRTDQARAMLDTLLALPEIRAMGNLYWVALYERASIALEQGYRDEGVQLLIQSVDAIESVRSTIAFEAGKIGFAGDKQTVYAALIGALAQAGDWRQAFEYVERAKARALVDLLAQRRDLGAPPSADDNVRALFAQAATVDSSMGYATSDETRRGIKVVADARDALADVAPEAASLISVQKVEIGEIISRIGADESLVDYYLQNDDLFAFVLTSRSIEGFKLSAKGLEEEIRAFRDAINRRDASAGEIGRSLYERLIQPLLAHLRGTELTIAPHGALHYLPFAALPDGDAYLIDRFSLRLVPSADTLVYLRTEPPNKVGKLLALGNPDLDTPALDLPNAEREAIRVAAMFPNSRALVRADASKSAVKELGGGFSMLHFATHGKFDADAPLSSGLYLARGEEPNGVLTVSDLYSLEWDLDLVTLSACETGLGKVANGDDVIGLTRGFLYAGAHSIVASLWEVDDAATAHLMESFYRNLATHGKREALRLAQIDTRQLHPDPWFWGAFNVMGRAD